MGMYQENEKSENFSENTVPEDNSAPAVKKSRKESTGASIGKTVLLYLHDVAYLLSLFLVVLLIFFRIVVVSGPSMKDTLVDGDNLLILSSTFYKNPEYGDIVIISKKSFENGEPIIKRVIATENQWIHIDFSAGIVYVGEDLQSMKPLQEDYTRTPTTLPEGMQFPLQVPDGCVFVMGDNRNDSKDSRSLEIGIIDNREIIGKAFFLVFPGTDGRRENRDFGRIGVLR